MSNSSPAVLRLGRLFLVLLSFVEARDLCFLVGLTFVFVGGVRISAPWTFVVVGALLIALSLIASRKPRGH